MKKTDIHFEIERVQSWSKSSENFDAMVELKSLIKNGTSGIGNDISQKGTSFGRKKLSGEGKRKSARPKSIHVG